MSSDPISSIADMDCNNFFDHIDDLLDFSEDNNKTCHNSMLPRLWNTSPHSLLGPELASELSIPYEDIVQMEWLSNFMEDSFSTGDTMTLDRKQFPVADDAAVAAAVAPVQFHLPSPISVLESSSSSSTSSCSEGGKVLPLSPDNVRIRGGCGRARSKRPRPPTLNPGSAMQLLAPAQSFNNTFIACGGELNKSPSLIKITAAAGQKKVKRGVKPSCVAEKSHVETNVEPNASESQAGVRKCLHCEITKTPQWRAGPLGPKTLCNACGVRYKSGRLFPEYRPAASPTFVPSLHSNSHKKVLEMRTTTPDTLLTTEDLTGPEAQPEFIPNEDALSKYI